MKNSLEDATMEKLEQQLESFCEILSDEQLQQYAEKYDVADKRIRRLPIKVFFWLMVLSNTQPKVRGCLFQLVAFFIAALTKLFPTDDAISLSKMAISRKLKGVNWFFFRGVYNALLNKYVAILSVDDRKLLSKFRNAFIIDATIIRINKVLEKIFKSVHKGQAALKINTKFSLRNLSVAKIQVTEGKRHDSRFKGITQEANILGYFAFWLFAKIIAAKSFFVCRLKSCCDPLIVAVKQEEFQYL